MRKATLTAEPNAKYFVAVHVGSCRHDTMQVEADCSDVLASACEKAASVLRSGGTSEHAAAQAIRYLEVWHLTSCVKVTRFALQAVSVWMPMLTNCFFAALSDLARSAQSHAAC